MRRGVMKTKSKGHFMNSRSQRSSEVMCYRCFSDLMAKGNSILHSFQVNCSSPSAHSTSLDGTRPNFPFLLHECLICSALQYDNALPSKNGLRFTKPSIRGSFTTPLAELYQISRSPAEYTLTAFNTSKKPH